MLLQSIVTLGSSRWDDLSAFIQGLTLDDIQRFLDRYSALGPLPGIALPVLEALLPFLPLVVFIVANSSAYGLWYGFLLSWIGAVLGAVLVFGVARRFGGRYGDRLRARRPRVEKFFSWIEQKGFTPIFVLSCFPFTPSALVNIAAGLSKIPMHTFLISIIMGKAVMIFILSFLGHDIPALIHHPWRLIAAVLVLMALWLVGKKLEARYM